MNNALLIIPCCKTKALGGSNKPVGYVDPLSSLVTDSTYSKIEDVRNGYSNLLRKPQQYMKAIDRYTGHLYRAVPNFAEIVKEYTNSENQPHLLILSALYGLLHPNSLINDYDLRLNKARSHWTAHFSAILEDYVLQNDIKEIRIYCGSDYAKLLQMAIKPLKKNKSITKAVIYKVSGYGAGIICKHHGLQLLKDIHPSDPRIDSSFERDVTEINI